MLYSFPPNDFDAIERGYEEFAERWGPIIDVFEAEGVRFALEVHPTEIAYDFVTTRKALDGDRRPRRASASTSTRATSSTSSSTRRRSSPSSATASSTCTSRTPSAGSTGARRSSAATCNFGEPGRGWDFVSPGHGDVDFEAMFRALNRIGYEGPLSIEWEDSGMDRDWGAPDALAFVRRTDFAPSAVAFDAAFAKEA